MMCFILKRKNELIMVMSILNGATFVTCVQTFVGATAPCLVHLWHTIWHKRTLYGVLYTKKKNGLIIAMSILNGATFITCAQTLVCATAHYLAHVWHTIWCKRSLYGVLYNCENVLN